MSENRRTGSKSKRSMRTGTLEYRHNHYLIVTDTEKTEKNYIEGLKNSLSSEVNDNIVVKVVTEKAYKMIDKCLEIQRFDPQFRESWIVIDRDEVSQFDKIIQSAESLGINTAWSNPCIEIWFYAYFGSMPNTTGSVQCCKKFENIFHKKTGKLYEKADKNIYEYLISFGNEKKAISIAKKRYLEYMNELGYKPSEMNPSTTMFKLLNTLMGRE